MIRDFTLALKFVADEVYLFLRKPEKNHEPTQADSHEVIANLEMSILSEQLQEDEREFNRSTQEEDAATYTTLHHSNVRETHVYDVISGEGV